MKQWHNFVRHLVESCLRTLHDIFPFPLSGAKGFLCMHQLRENWFNKWLGTSFLDNLANALLLAPWQNWLLAHIHMHPATSVLTHTDMATGDNDKLR
jgi:aminoglycoside phosphotransferase (APT) family kinase protein